MTIALGDRSKLSAFAARTMPPPDITTRRHDPTVAVCISAGTTLIAGGFPFQNAGTQANGDLRGSVAVPPPSNLYITKPISNLGIGSSDSTAVGLAVFSPFGTLTRWPDSSPFSTATTKAAFELIDIRPSIAFQTLPDLAIGLGSGCVSFSGAFRRRTGRNGSFAGQVGSAFGRHRRGLNGRDTAAGWNTSLLYTRHWRNEDDARSSHRPYLSQPGRLHLDGQLLASGPVSRMPARRFVVPQVPPEASRPLACPAMKNEWKLELDGKDIPGEIGP